MMRNRGWAKLQTALIGLTGLAYAFGWVSLVLVGAVTLTGPFSIILAILMLNLKPSVLLPCSVGLACYGAYAGLGLQLPYALAAGGSLLLGIAAIDLLNARATARFESLRTNA